MDRSWIRAHEDYLDPDRFFNYADDEGRTEYEYDVYEDDTPICEHCKAQGTEEHNGGCPNEEVLFTVIAEFTV